jgi:hypothetical protein
MNMNEWDIKSPGNACTATTKPFAEGEKFYSILIWKDGVYERLDFCEEAWKQRNENIQTLSSWHSIFKPAPVITEALKKDDAESLLRRFMQEADDSHRNARYILALMLERKRILKPIDRQTVNGETVLIYEHATSGETWMIPDPQLKLADLVPVQNEVSALLNKAVAAS